MNQNELFVLVDKKDNELTVFDSLGEMEKAVEPIDVRDNVYAFYTSYGFVASVVIGIERKSF